MVKLDDMNIYFSAIKKVVINNTPKYKIGEKVIINCDGVYFFCKIISIRIDVSKNKIYYLCSFDRSLKKPEYFSEDEINNN